jgi:V-type H+-transporting ATPase subunit E
VAFIKQEALEKAREIKVKADEEFAIEKVELAAAQDIHITSLMTACHRPSWLRLNNKPSTLTTRRNGKVQR